MKAESPVIVNQNVTVNLYLDLAHTARHMPGETRFKVGNILIFKLFTKIFVFYIFLLNIIY